MTSKTAQPDAPPDDMREQVRQLRAQLDDLMREKVSPAMEQAAGQAADALAGQAEALAVRVRERPLAALLIAAGIGYLLGRLTR